MLTADSADKAQVRREGPIMTECWLRFLHIYYTIVNLALTAQIIFTTLTSIYPPSGIERAHPHSYDQWVPN
jgi:hypothetical protein